MAKVTSKLQITIPKLLAERYGIRPGDEIDWSAAAGAIRVVPHARRGAGVSRDERLRLFDQATRRQREREAHVLPAVAESRGWSRDELYDRGRTD